MMRLSTTVPLVAVLLGAVLPAGAPPAGPAARAAAVLVPTDGVATLLTDTEARWVPFDLTPGNQIRFELMLDGRTLTAILDTGVSYSLLAKGSPAADPARVTSGGNATAIGGAVAIGWLSTRELAFGGLTRRGGGVSVAALPAIATGSAQAVDMLVGRDVTGGQALDIDYANHRFRLLPSGRMPFRGDVAPLSISAQRHVYESAIRLGGQRLAPMVVDTGDGSSITVSAPSWTRAALLGLPTTTAVSFGLAGPTVNTLAIAPAVTLGERTAQQVELRIEPVGGFSQMIGVAGRIGSGFLQHYRVLLDPGAGRMVLSATPGADTPPLRSTSGLLVGIEQARLKVLHVMKNGPAEASGWHDGDEICTIDGAAIPADYAASPLAAWSIGAPGKVVSLGLCGGAVRPLTLRRFY